jgi:hypothetical protein
MQVIHITKFLPIKATDIVKTIEELTTDNQGRSQMVTGVIVVMGSRGALEGPGKRLWKGL